MRPDRRHASARLFGHIRCAALAHPCPPALYDIHASAIGASAAGFNRRPFLTTTVIAEIPFRSLPMRADPTGSVFRSESGTIPARVYRQHILSPDLREVPWRLTGKRLSPTIQAERRFAESEVNSMKKVLLISGIALFLFCLALSPASAYTQHLQVVSQDCSGDQPPPPGPEKP